jgi:hypothetical protein
MGGYVLDSSVQFKGKELVFVKSVMENWIL